MVGKDYNSETPQTDDEKEIWTELFARIKAKRKTECRGLSSDF